MATSTPQTQKQQQQGQGFVQGEKKDTQIPVQQGGQQQGMKENIPMQGQQQQGFKEQVPMQGQQQFNQGQQQFNQGRSAWDDVHAEQQRSREYIGDIPQEGQMMNQGGGQQWGVGGYNPFRELVRMQRRIDNLMDQTFADFPISGFGNWGNVPMIGQGTTGTRGRGRGQGTGQLTIARPLADWHPVCDVKENDKELIVHAELPGVDKDKVKLDVSQNILTVSGERSNVSRKENDRYHATERAYGYFSRSVALPDGVDPSSINATYKDGVLEVVVPKPTKAITGRTNIQIK
jgi:HSP20 family protein